MTNVDFGFMKLDAWSCPLGNVALGCRPMEEITYPLPVESLGVALAPDGGHVEHLPSSGPLEHSVLEAKWRNDNLDSSSEQQFGSDLGQSSLELEDVIRREVLRSRSMGRVSAHVMRSSLDEVRSEGLQPLEMTRAAYVEDYNFDVPEGMEWMTYTRRRPDGGDTRGVNAVDMVPMCRTVSGVTR